MAAGAAMGNSQDAGGRRREVEKPPFALDAIGRRLADLVSDNWPRVYRIAELVTGDEQIAQQMTGCVFYNDVGQHPARAWMPLDIVRCMVQRLERKYPDLGELAGRDPDAEIPAIRMQHDLTKPQLIAMLQRLPVTERMIFVLFHSFEYSASEIAGLMLIPEADVRQGAYASLLMAREVLTKR